ncbi:hypothetical protein BG003_011754, partial [Podila horticola]
MLRALSNITTSQCTGGGSYSPSDCPDDPADVKCCTYGRCNNGEGICLPTENCGGMSVPCLAPVQLTFSD